MIIGCNRMIIVYDLCIGNEKSEKFSAFFKEYKLVGAPSITHLRHSNVLITSWNAASDKVKVISFESYYAIL